MSSAARQIASSAFDAEKSVAKQGAKKALEVGKSSAVDAGKKFSYKSLNTKIEEHFTKIYRYNGTRNARHYSVNRWERYRYSRFS